MGRHLRHPVRDHPVRVLADPGRAVGSFRPPPGDPAVLPRAGRGLPADGAGAVAAVAADRAHFLGRVLGQLHHRQRLHRRHHSAGEARAGVRHDRCGVRRGLHHWSNHRWPAGGDRSAPAVLVLGRAGAAEFPVRLVRAAGVVAEGKAHAPVRLVACQSDRFAGAAEALPAGVWPGGGGADRQPRPLRVPEHLRAVRRVPVQVE